MKKDTFVRLSKAAWLKKESEGYSCSNYSTRFCSSWSFLATKVIETKWSEVKETCLSSNFLAHYISGCLCALMKGQHLSKKSILLRSRFLFVKGCLLEPRCYQQKAWITAFWFIKKVFRKCWLFFVLVS